MWSTPHRPAKRCGDDRRVGLTGFEPATSPTRTERATKLRHSPKGRRLALPYCGCVRARRYILPRVARRVRRLQRGRLGADHGHEAGRAGTQSRRGRRRPRRSARCGCCGSAASTSRPTSRLRAATGAGSSSSGRARSGSSRADACSGSRSSTSPIGSRAAARAACCRWRSRATTASSRRFYVYYTDQQGFLQIDQFRAAAGAPNRADPESRRSVIRVPHPRGNHKGGQLQVGADGMLYAGFGDGGGGGDPDENAQNLSRILGKMIRIDPRANGGYSIPADNPFRGRSGARPEIYAYGLRNPYRFSFDRRARQPDDRRRRPGRDRGDRLRAGPRGRAAAPRRLQLRLGRLRGPQPLRERQRARRTSRP